MGNCLKKQEEGLFATSSKKGVENVEWMNQILLRLWPYIDVYVKEVMQGSVELEKSVNAGIPVALQPFKLLTFDIGDVPPRIEGIKVHDEIRRGEIHIDLELNFSSNCNMVVSMNKTKAGVKNLKILGTIRVVMKPLINRIPLIAAITFFFHNQPDLNFDLTKLAMFLDVPVVKQVLNAIIFDQIATRLVLPNRFPVALAKGVDVSLLQYPRPQGVVRVTVVKAKQLIVADWSITGKGKSDPFVVIHVGAQTEKTKIVFKNLNPIWNETFDMVVDVAFGQQVYFDVFDYDAGKTNDNLGKASMDIDRIRKKGMQTKWLKLKGVKHGTIQVKARWLWVANDPLELDRVLKKVPKGSNTALVTCFLTSAFNIPKEKKGLLDTISKFKITVGESTVESVIKPSANWEHRFRFLVIDPKKENLHMELIGVPLLADTFIGATTIRIKDTVIKAFVPKHKHMDLVSASQASNMSEKQIGGITICLNDLLLADNMEMETYYYYVKMRLFIGILTPNASPKWVEQDFSLMRQEP